MNTHVTKISIPTEQLRALLPEEAMVELQGIAIEKIAEELRRKTTGDKLEAVIKDISQKIAANCREDFTRSYQFPREARAIITQIAQTAVNDALATALIKFSRDVDARMEAIVARTIADLTAQGVRAIQAYVNDAAKNLEKMVEVKARTEFLAVLKEAKEAGI